MISLKIFRTPVKISPSFLVFILPLWAVITWLGIRWHPGRGLWAGILIGFVTVLLLLVAEIGHPIAHIFSARLAGAPMDEIRISAETGMPRTLYWNNEVAPKAHRMRAMGGVAFNLLMFSLSMAIYALVPAKSLAAELSAWSTAGHALLFTMSMAPVPSVDGGSILKWTLVNNGKTIGEADKIVNRVDWAIGIAAAAAGVVLLALRSWVAGGILMGIALIFIVTAVKNRYQD